jgi:lipopolysaccharide export system protein LptA
MASFVTFFLLITFSLFLAPGERGWAAEKKTGLLGQTGKGENPRSQEPLRITSSQLEADNKSMIITFTGNVVAKQGEMTMYSDGAQVFYEKKEEGNEIREIIATGNVKIQDGERVATGQKAVFTNQDQKIVLTGQPKVWQGKDMVSGDKIIVLLDEDKSFVESSPDRRVEVILYPKSKPSPEKK